MNSAVVDAAITSHCTEKTLSLNESPSSSAHAVSKVTVPEMSDLLCISSQLEENKREVEASDGFQPFP